MENTRIENIRNYMIKVLEELVKDEKYSVNANLLPEKPNNYSLVRIPTDYKMENWIIGKKLKKEVYNFICRKPFTYETIENLNNIGFFESLEKLIEENNKKRILPKISNIDSIECLTCGALSSVNSNTAKFSIQIQVIYRD